MTLVKRWHTGRVWFMTLSASLRIVVMCSSLLHSFGLVFVFQVFSVQGGNSTDVKIQVKIRNQKIAI